MTEDIEQLRRDALIMAQQAIGTGVTPNLYGLDELFQAADRFVEYLRKPDAAS